MYGKLENGALVYAPINFTDEKTEVTIFNFNKNIDLMREYGYKEIVDMPPTIDTEKQYYSFKGYSENADNITVLYSVHDKSENDNELSLDERVARNEQGIKHNYTDINDNIFPYVMDIELMVLDIMALNGYTKKNYKIKERTGVNMTSKQALERLIRQKKLTLEDALDRIVRYNDAGKITDVEAVELTDLAHEIL